MTTDSPVEISKRKGDSATSKDNKKSKKSSTKTAQEDATITAPQNDACHLIRHERCTSVLGQPLLVDDDTVLPASAASSLTLFQSENARRAGQLKLEAVTERLSVTCRNFGAGSPALWPYKYAVALVSDSGAVRVWDAQVLVSERRVACVTEAAGDDVIRFGASSSTNTSSDALPSAATHALNYRDAQNLLGEAFGTRKRKQAIASAEKNQIKVDGMGEESISFISKSLVVDEEAINGVAAASSANSATTALIPPFNAQTADASLIYALEDLIPSPVYQSLPVQEFMQAREESDFSALQEQFGLKAGWMMRIRNVLLSGNQISSAARERALRLCLFAAQLAAFRELKEAAINGANGSVAAVQSWIPGCSAEMATDLLSRFADALTNNNPNGRIKHKLPATLRDKAVLYVLAVLLHLDAFSVNLTATAELLNLTPSKLTTFFRALGCRVEKPSAGESVKIGERLLAVKYARLTAPLTFPTPPKRK